MKTYRVEWSAEVEAENPREAAQKAQEIQRGPLTLQMQHFEVWDEEGDSESIDLADPELLL